MHRIFLPALLAGVLNPVSAQEPEWPEPRHRILVVGTFHFADAGLDSYRPTTAFEVRSAVRQREIEDVVAQLAAFAPTRVAVEVLPTRQRWLDSLYAEYRAGRHELGVNEVYQLGFRLAARLGHPQVYAADAQRRFYEPWVDPDSFAVANRQVGMLDPGLDTLYFLSARAADESKASRTLHELLLGMNTLSAARRMHGQYLVGNFEVGNETEYPGVDSKTAWFNRNLRIFANLQRLVRLPEERILFIVGAGHTPILRHSIEASPQFDFVELSEVLRRMPMQ